MATRRRDVTFRIAGEQKIHCPACEQRVESGLARIPGVEEVRATAESQEIRVALDTEQIDPEEVESCGTSVTAQHPKRKNSSPQKQKESTAIPHSFS